MNWALGAQLVLSGLASGSVYALVAIGVTAVFRLGGVFNFAAGDLVNVAVFAFLAALGGGAGVLAAGWPALALALSMSLAVTVAAAMLLDRAGVDPFVHRSRPVGWVAGTAAAGILFRSLVLMFFPNESYSIPDLLPLHLLPANGVVAAGGVSIDLRDLLVLAVALALATLVDLWTRRSRPGRAMRAATDDAEAAQLCGISPDRMRLTSFALAAGLAVAAALLIAPERPVTVMLGVTLGIKGTAAAVIAGLSSTRRAVVAGLALGVTESVLAAASTPGMTVGALTLPALGPFTALHDLLPVALLILAVAMLPQRIDTHGALD
ncbi:MAG: branched-chain amino acid ABC transporter permease [Candidatus Dormibacteria bacterium]